MSPTVKLDGRVHETILVIEGNADVRQFMVAALQSFGYRVLATDGQEIAATVKEHSGSIDFLITDIVLPDATVLMIAEQLSASSQCLAILNTCWQEDIPTSRKGIAEMDFIQRPFTANELAEQVHRLLRRTRRKRVLIIDDEPGILRFASKVLAAEGFDVRTAENGQLAMAVIENDTVDLVITDIVMPECDGIETIVTLRNLRPSLPIIAISGATDGKYFHVAQQLGATTTLNKPFSAESLLTAVNQLLLERRESDQAC